MKVLLSIKPEFVEKIFAGTKKYEFRKSLFRRSDVKFVVVYASAPVKRVVGEFEIDNILSGELDEIWERTKQYSGISKDFYDSYFGNRTIAKAIKIGNITKFKKFKFLSEYNIIQAPQSFCYISE